MSTKTQFTAISLLTLSTWLFLSGGLLLTGCANNQKVYGVNQKTPDESSIRPNLELAANSIERSLLSLAETQEPYQSHAINTVPLVTNAGGMGGTVNIDWSGPIEPLVQKIASYTQYKVKVLGNEPAVAVIVSVTGTQMLVADVIKSAGLQAGNRANIVVYPTTRIIELRYSVT